MIKVWMRGEDAPHCGDQLKFEHLDGSHPVLFLSHEYATVCLAVADVWRVEVVA